MIDHDDWPRAQLSDALHAAEVRIEGGRDCCQYLRDVIVISIGRLTLAGQHADADYVREALCKAEDRITESGRYKK